MVYNKCITQSKKQSNSNSKNCHSANREPIRKKETKKPTHTFLPCQLLQAADELEGYHAVGVMKGQRIGRHCTYVNTLHTQGMLGNVGYGRTNTVLVDLKQDGL